ncbi:PHP domain-like protein [Wolfiporia cocos MD-104 SS10]|uniref:PHP domain-like protein n=1 Tax=Wolfiporia cocos (strain MD-104) TaxID=742152 RepID=A0A2H3J4M5_WOLCO|nr:PHP domain-like protein [Wolfiporia cocos MD-104 SS10]
MFIDLNVPVPAVTVRQANGQSQSKKGKEKQPQASATGVRVFTPTQISAIENRIDLLEHLGYTVIAFNHVVQRKIDPKTHVNVLVPLLAQLRKRTGILMLKRLTIVLDEESEKGFGLTNQNAQLVSLYDLIALLPTTLTTFSLTCLTHTLPSPLTAHIIALPLTLPRLPFHLKHTLVRTALKNGAVFEIYYAGALGTESDWSGAGEGGTSAKRNWWAAAREVVRVTKGKGILVSGGVMSDADLRTPRDVGNLITMLGLSQDVAHSAATKLPQSLIVRAQTRKTYRAVFSEPKVVIPESVTPAAEPPHQASNNASETRQSLNAPGGTHSITPDSAEASSAQDQSESSGGADTSKSSSILEIAKLSNIAEAIDAPDATQALPQLNGEPSGTTKETKKRSRGEMAGDNATPKAGTAASAGSGEKDDMTRKRKRKRTKESAAS